MSDEEGVLFIKAYGIAPDDLDYTGEKSESKEIADDVFDLLRSEHGHDVRGVSVIVNEEIHEKLKGE